MSGCLVHSQNSLFLASLVSPIYEVKPLLFQGESSGVEFAAAEGENEETEIAEVAQFLLEIRTGVGKGASGGGVAD